MFSFRDDWHQDDRALPLIRQYQLTLDAVLRDRPGLASCAVHCCHCRVRFFTHPRNAGRLDLRCPFGCRVHHRRQCGNARSRKHNQTDEGRANKKRLNTAARIKASQATPSDSAPTPLEQSSQLTADSPDADFADAATVDESPSVDQSSSANTSSAILKHLTLHLDGFVLDEPTLVNSRILPYVRMIVSVFERRVISRDELIAALRRSIRQRSMGRSIRREYVLRYLNQHPP